MLRHWNKAVMAVLPAALLAVGAALPSVSIVASEARGEDRERVATPNFQQAMQYNREYLKQYVYDTEVTPRWIGKSDQFWYAFRTSAGTLYWRVNPKLGTKEPLFDRATLRAKLGEEIKRPVDDAQLPITRVEVNDEGTKLKFVAANLQFEYDLLTEALTNQGRAPAQTPPANFGGRGGGQLSREEMERLREEFLRQRENEERQQEEDRERGEQREQGQGQGQQRDQQQDGEQERGRQNDSETQQRGGRPGGAAAFARLNDYRNFSPDRSMYVFAKDHNLYLVEVKPEDIIPDARSKSDTTKAEGAETKAGDAVKADEAAKAGEATKTQEAKGQNEASKSTETAAGTTVGTGEGKASESRIVVESEGSNSTEKAKSDSAGAGEAAKEETLKPAPQDAARAADAAQAAAVEEKPIPRTDPKIDDRAIQLTTDGIENYSFSSRGGMRRGGLDGRGEEAAKTPPSRKTRPNVVWSKDSKSFYVMRSDSRGVGNLWVINSLSEPRPTLETYPYPVPGEEAVRRTELYVFSAESKKLARVAPKWKDEAYENLHYGKTGDDLRFMRRDRVMRNAEFCSLNPASGEAKCLIAEGFENANLTTPTYRYLEGSDELIWWSERSGWGHFYLYDRDGGLKNAITSGPYRASRIVEVDEKNRTLYFLGNAREPNENIYYEHLYAVRLDGTGLTLLDPGDASHKSHLSPSRQYLVDNWSRVDAAPKSVLRDSGGREIMVLEVADLSHLEKAGWKLPETFVVKAADGVTDLYGNLWKPFDFNPNKRYPIIVNVYPGPQMEGVSHTFAASGGTMQLAQLGFIVVTVGHRGGTPTRSKAYANYGYNNLRDYGLADKKFAIEQLAARYPWIDITRVGIYGHSGGAFMTAAALLQKPYNEFFKVGIATSGNHDNNIYGNYWAERYHGMREVAVVESKAKSESRAGRGAGETVQQTSRSEAFDSPDPQDALQTEFEEWLDDDAAFEALQELLNPEWAPPPALRAEYGAAPEFRGFDEAVAPQDNAQSTKSDGTESQATGTSTKEDAKSDASAKGEAKAEAAEKKTRFEIKVPTNQELATNLKGRLFLIHGELDNNVHPANTMRLADALIKANKRFDMMIIPGKRHAYGDYQPYVTQRMWEYFAEHLMGEELKGADLYSR